MELRFSSVSQGHVTGACENILPSRECYEQLAESPSLCQTQKRAKGILAGVQVPRDICG